MSPNTLHWGVAGQLVIHCALGQARLMGPFARKLPGGARAFDLPGHGESPPWDPSLGYQETCVAWASGLVPASGRVIGHSFGGTVALRLAVENPELVRELVLIEPVYFAALRLHDAQAWAAYSALSADFEAAARAGDYETTARRFLDIWGRAPWERLPTAARALIVRQMPLIEAQHAGITEDSGNVFAPGRLEALEIPVTLIRGSDTQPSVPAIHTVLLARLPNAREHVIDGAGHMAPLTHAAAVAAAIPP